MHHLRTGTSWLVQAIKWHGNKPEGFSKRPEHTASLGTMATENTLMPMCRASLAASCRPPQGSLYPSVGCPSVTTIMYFISWLVEPLESNQTHGICFGVQRL